MAIGAALLFNIKLPINFNSPYKATNIQDFWRRWHVTLSRFLKDYVYISLGGNRLGDFRTYNNLMITFVIGGLWHGAGWTFIFWGFLHGLALVLHRVWSQFGLRLNSVIGWVVTFNFVNIAWVFFRANEWEDAIRVLKGMIGLSGVVLPGRLSGKFSFLSSYGVEFGQWLRSIEGSAIKVTSLLVIFLIVVVFFKNSMEHMKSFKVGYRTSIASALLILLSMLSLNKVSEFLYFNF